MKKEFDRKQGIGGSDATKLYNGEWHTLWLEKIGDAKPVDLSDVLPVQMGVHTEPFNIQWFEKQTGLKVDGKQQTFFHPQYNYLYAHVDGLILPTVSNEGDAAIIECKHTNAFTNSKKQADKYKAQIQHYLMVTGYHKLYFSAFYGNMKWEALEITADAEFQEQLLNAEVLFWHFVTTKKEPPEHISFDNFNKKEFSDGRTIIPILSRA
ncbi:Phage-related protein, predicted endonuclease (COG5377) [uncultured Mediterranean phage uvMED]|nr:Phage-related protein, predicted endonuclease (COG5377) [uncultured Mediterranean phage uvMED]